MSHSVDPDQIAPVGADCSYSISLIWACTVCSDLSVQKLRIIMTPNGREVGEHIAFDADPVVVLVGVASCLHSHLLNQLVDFDQMCTDT